MFDKLKSRLNYDILELIRRDREGEYITSSDIVTAINSYGEHFIPNSGELTFSVVLGSTRPNKPIKVYQKGLNQSEKKYSFLDFEEHYLASLKDYYQRESTNYIAQNGVSLYMRKAERRNEEEDFRARKYLHEESLEKVLRFFYFRN